MKERWLNVNIEDLMVEYMGIVFLFWSITICLRSFQNKKTFKINKFNF